MLEFLCWFKGDMKVAIIGVKMHNQRRIVGPTNVCIFLQRSIIYKQLIRASKKNPSQFTVQKKAYTRIALEFGMGVGEWISMSMLTIWISFDISVRFTFYSMVHNDYQCLQGSKFSFDLIQDAPARSVLARGRHILSQRTPQL